MDTSVQWKLLESPEGVHYGDVSLYILYLTTMPGYVYSATVMYIRCKCVYTPTCSAQVAIYPYQVISNGWNVPGFSAPCSVLESLLHLRDGP